MNDQQNPTPAELVSLIKAHLKCPCCMGPVNAFLQNKGEGRVAIEVECLDANGVHCSYTSVTLGIRYWLDPARWAKWGFQPDPAWSLPAFLQPFQKSE